FATTSKDSGDIISSFRYPGTDYRIIGLDSFAVPTFIRQFESYTMSRDILFIIELEEMYCPRRSRFQWKNPGTGTSHCLEYIWEFFGRVIEERNPDIRLDDLMRCE
ncbi:MAG: hypothetical protein D3903_21590, partial [Candidatus Electrothrix sp. GM3_4]|nr:hypothetical protein [Candidatus Electrothrix sp. GM3_4]